MSCHVKSPTSNPSTTQADISDGQVSDSKYGVDRTRDQFLSISTSFGAVFRASRYLFVDIGF